MNKLFIAASLLLFCTCVKVFPADVTKFFNEAGSFIFVVWLVLFVMWSDKECRDSN